jgi:hypothetical protein
MDYLEDIGKFVIVEFTREGQPAVAKGILKTVEHVNSGKQLLRIVNINDPEKINIIAEDSINSYFARPLKEE